MLTQRNLRRFAAGGANPGQTTSAGAAGSPGTAGSPGAAGSPATPGQTSSPSPVVVRVRAGVRGYTRLTFLIDVFRAALAKTLAVALSRITVADVAAGDARRAADPSVAVTSDVGYPAGTSTAGVLAAAAASADVLTANLRAGGMDNATVTAVVPTVYYVEAAPAPSSPAMTTAAAVAVAVLGLGVLATVAVVASRTLAPPPPNLKAWPNTVPAASSRPEVGSPVPVSAGSHGSVRGLVHMPVPLEQQPMWAQRMAAVQSAKTYGGSMVTSDLVMLGRH